MADTSESRLRQKFRSQPESRRGSEEEDMQEERQLATENVDGDVLFEPCRVTTAREVVADFYPTPKVLHPTLFHDLSTHPSTPTVWPTVPTQATCPYCQATGLTRVHSAFSLSYCFWSGLCCMTAGLCVLGVCCCRDVVHRCGVCRRQVGYRSVV